MCRVAEHVAHALLGAGCGPALVQILLVFPLTTPFGVGGVGLGALTPLFVFIFNTIGWSIPAYAYFRLNGEGAGFCRVAPAACPPSTSMAAFPRLPCFALLTHSQTLKAVAFAVAFTPHSVQSLQQLRSRRALSLDRF